MNSLHADICESWLKLINWWVACNNTIKQWRHLHYQEQLAWFWWLLRLLRGIMDTMSRSTPATKLQQNDRWGACNNKIRSRRHTWAILGTTSLVVALPSTGISIALTQNKFNSKQNENKIGKSGSLTVSINNIPQHRMNLDYSRGFTCFISQMHMELQCGSHVLYFSTWYANCFDVKHTLPDYWDWIRSKHEKNWSDFTADLERLLLYWIHVSSLLEKDPAKMQMNCTIMYWKHSRSSSE